MPWTDWQFWVVTLAFLWGAKVIVRQVVPRRRGEGSACGSCASGAAACAKPDETADASSELPVVSGRP